MEVTMPLIPYLYYQDVSRAMTFLSRSFGFRPFGARTRGKDGKLQHAGMRLGSSVVMMGCPTSEYRNPQMLGQSTQCIVITLRSGIDTHFQRAVKAGARVLQEPQDNPFGTRRYGVADPEGHEWYFSQRIGRKRPAKIRRPARSRLSRTR
jgi:uncharacterized glyoxalase superfamily protein PhnB